MRLVNNTGVLRQPCNDIELNAWGSPIKPLTAKDLPKNTALKLVELGYVMAVENFTKSASE